jgi:regulatory protein
VAGTITAIKRQKKNRTRVNIYLDGAYALSTEKILALGLHIGQHLADAQIEELKERDAEELALRRAVRLLSRRPRSEAELRRNFERHGTLASVQGKVLDRLRQRGLVDDAVFASTWVENRREFRPKGILALRAELRQKGIPRQAIDAALEGYDEEQAAISAGRKAGRRWQGLPEDVFRHRLQNHLLRRGFSYSVISSVVRELWRELAAGEDESEAATWRHNG